MTKGLLNAQHSYFNNNADFTIEKEVTFDGSAGSGAVGTVDLFTVTGAVDLRLFAVCTTNLAGATATIEVGVDGETAELIAQTTATDIDAGEFWHDASPDGEVEASSVAAQKIIANGGDIIATVGTANITGGVIKFICKYKPISNDGNVVAA